MPKSMHPRDVHTLFPIQAGACWGKKIPVITGDENTFKKAHMIQVDKIINRF